MVALAKKKQKGNSSWVVHVMVLALLGLVMLIVIVRMGETFQDVAASPQTNSLNNYDNLNLGHLLRRTSGNGWKMWDKERPIITKDTKFKECRWTTFKATNGQTAKMCVHYGDAVSRAVINRGRWADCDVLTTQFDDTNPDKKDRIFMDVGANIGACVLQMLFTTEAPVIAFEPEPMNLFCLTNTIMRLEPRYRDRFLLFPLALGDAEGGSIIHSKVGDYGNAVIGEVVKDRNKEKFKNPTEIRIEALDTVITVDDENIALMKLHAQGSECLVLDGMPKMLPHIKAIHTEIGRKHLEKQGCSEEEYMKRLEDAGFEIQNLKKDLLDEEQQGSAEILALNKNLGSP
jgi:FkbM family methyltransferase